MIARALLILCLLASGASGAPLVAEYASTPVFAPGEQSPCDAAFLPDGSLVYACSRTNALHSLGVGDPGRPIRLAIPGLGEASGVHVAEDGTITIADRRKHQILRWQPGQRGAMHFGSFGHDEGDLCKPSDVCVEGDLVAVADTGNSRVQLFTASGEHLRSIGEWASGAGDLVRPVGIAVHNEEIFVCDEALHRINVYSTEGGFLRSFASLGEMDGLLLRPSRIDIHNGVLYVADSRNHRVQAFDPETGKVTGRWGGHALRPREHGGKLETPTSVVISPDGKRAAVCEPTEGRIQLFDLIEARNTPAALSGLGTTHFDRFMAGGPDTIILSSPDLQTVEVYDLTGVRGGGTPIMVTRFGSQGWGFGKFVRIAGIAFDEEKQLVYVTDSAQRRLSIWKLDREPGDEARYVPTMARLVQTLDFMKLREANERMQTIAPFVPGAIAVWCDEYRLSENEASRSRLIVVGDVRSGASFTCWDANKPPTTVRPPSLDESGFPQQILALSQIWKNGPIHAFDGVSKSRIVAPIDNHLPVQASDTVPGAMLETLNGTVTIREPHLGPVISVFGPGILGGVAIADLMEPSDICSHGDMVSVLDYANHRVIFLNADGEPVSVLGARPFVMDAQKELKAMHRARESE